MADQKISELTALTGANLADVDAFAVVDTSAVQTKKITYAELKTALDTGTGFVRITGDAMTGALGITQTGSASTIPLSVHSNLNSSLPILELRSTGNSSSTIDLRADGTGDPKIYFDLNGATAFSIGVDNSDGDKFKISGNHQLGTNPRLTIDSSGNTTFTGTVTANAGVVVDNITIDGNEIDVSSGNLMLDVAGYIELSSDDVGGSVYFSDGGTTYGRIYNSSSNLRIKSQIGDKSISFEGVDGSNPITALTLDMSNAGAANFVGNVGIGVIPARKLHIYNTAALDVALLESTQVFSTLAFKSSSNASTVTVGIDGAGNASFTNKLSSGHIKFATASTDRVTIDNSGRVGINSVPNTSWRNDASDTVLQLGTEATLHSDANVTTELWNNAYVNNSDQYKNISTRGSSRYMQYEGNHRFFTAASASAGSTISMGERLRITDAGTVLIGKTSSSFGTVGQEFRAAGVTILGRDGGEPLTLNRTSSDGGIVNFNKDNSTVGSIGTDNGSLTVSSSATGKTGLYFASGGLLPMNSGTIDSSDQVNIGSSSYQFKDLHLSGTANVGGTVAITSNTPILTFTESDQSNKQYQIGSFGAAFAIYDASASSFRYVLDTNGNHAFNDGNSTFGGEVIISSSNLTVNNGNAASKYLKLNASSSGDGHILLQRNNSNKWQISSNTSNNLVIDPLGGSSGVNINSTVASGKVAITGGTATSEASHVTFTNTQGAKTYAVGAGQSGVTNNGFVIRNVTDNSFPLVISDAGAATFGGTVSAPLLSVSTSSGKMAEFNSTHANHGYIVLKEDGTEKFYMGASTAVSGQTVGFTFYTASGDGIDFNTGGSNTPKLRITSDGKIGIGSTAPVTQLDVVSSGNARMLIHTDLDGGLAHLMFKTDSQNLDSRMKGAIIFKRDDPGTRGTGSLHLCVNGVNSDVNAGIADSKLSIDSSGNLLVGSTSNVLGSRAFIESTGSTHVIGARVGANGHYALGAINAAGTVVGGVVVNASSTTYATSSDYRLKENVDYTWDATTRLKQLKPARFNFIADDTNTLVDGFLAHEVSSVVPEAITGTKDAVDADGNPEYQGIDHSVLVPLLVKTIQELEARITALEA